MKKKIFLYSIVSVLLLVCGSFTIKNIHAIKVTSHEKFEASENTPGFFLDKVDWKSPAEMLKFTDLVVIGKFDVEPVKIEFKIPMLQQKKDERLRNYTESYSEYQFKIDKVIYGKTDSKVVTFRQKGNPNVDEYETKIKKGQKYLIFMQRNNEDGSYHATSFEEAIYNVDNNNKLNSFSNNKVFSTYNNNDVDELIKVIQ